MTTTTVLAQLSDLHICKPHALAYGRLDTARHLNDALALLDRRELGIDALVITGDLVDFGNPVEYRHLLALLESVRIPMFLLPGNHDHRAAMREAFSRHAYLGREGFIQYSTRIGGLRLIALDTVDEGCGSGRLCRERLDWLEAELMSDRASPTVIAMHHPPFNTLIGPMDSLGLLEGAERLEDLVACHRQVERVICGHVHRSIFKGFGGAVVSCCPSPAHQVNLDLSVAAPFAWIMEPPALHLHAWSITEGFTSHVVPIGSFDGPFPFGEA